jgi:hypothetical protein
VQAQTNDEQSEIDQLQTKLMKCKKIQIRLKEIAKNARLQLKTCEAKSCPPTLPCDYSEKDQQITKLSKEETLCKKIQLRLKEIAKNARLQLKTCEAKSCPPTLPCDYSEKDQQITNDFTRAALLNREKFIQNKFPKITTNEDIKSLETDIKFDQGNKPKKMVRVDVTAVADNGKKYLIKEEHGIFNLVEPKSGNITAFKFRVFFLDKKFHDGNVKKIEFDFSKEVIDKENVYTLSPKNIFYEKDSITHNTKNDKDEIRWIKDTNSPSIYALLVCNGQCDGTLANTSPPLLTKFECEYKIGSNDTPQDCTEYFRDASQDFVVEKVGQGITEETTLKLTMTMTISPVVKEVPQTEPVDTGENKIEEEENGSTAKTKSKDTSGDNKLVALQKDTSGDNKLVALQKVQFKPYTYLYGEPFDTAKICGYKYEFIDTKNSNIALTKTTAGQDYYFFAKKASKNKQVKTGDKLTVKVTPKPNRENYCISEEIKDIPIYLNDGIATVEFEVPHANPWLLVYATSTGFPNHNLQDTDEWLPRRLFWNDIFQKINETYTTETNTQKLYWLTGDVFKLKKEQSDSEWSSEWLVGGNTDKKTAHNVKLSQKHLEDISKIPPNSATVPSFNNYKKAILTYKKSHSTQNNGKYDNVIIIQGNDSFLRSICEDFNEVAISLEKQKISILYINPVNMSISDSYITDNGILTPLKSNKLPIYTCKQPEENGQIVSKLITFEYFTLQKAKELQTVQTLLENELNKIKN